MKTKAPAKSTKKVKIEKEVVVTLTNEVVEVVETLANEVIENQIEENSINEPTPEEFLKDFDWNLFEEGIETIKDDKLSEFEKLVEENFVDTYNESVIDGTIISLTEREAIIDINAKSEGVISLNEFRYNPDLKVGDKVNGEVVVIADYGAFVEVEQGVEGLIHVSEMSWSTHYVLHKIS